MQTAAITRPGVHNQLVDTSEKGEDGQPGVGTARSRGVGASEAEREQRHEEHHRGAQATAAAAAPAPALPRRHIGDREHSA